MSCTVAISNSPVFSPSSRLSVFCKSSSSCETLIHSPSSPSSSAASSSSPLRLLRSQKPPPSGLVRTSTDFPSSTSPTLSKRKRPARLNIPVASLSFAGSCGGLATPVVPRERQCDLVEVEGDEYSVCCKRGRREAMEDRYSSAVNVQGDSKQAFFGIFDGHGGAKAAEFAANNLKKNIFRELERSDENENENENENEIEMKQAVKHGYLNTDSEFLNEDLRGGSCCVTALIRKGKLVVSNAGDCRAVMSRGGVAEALTSDHRPSREDEMHRIESLGGYIDCCRGVWRIQGTLAVSRGIGDQYLKQWVIAEPETKILDIKPDFEFLILASDGLWDKVSNQEAVDIARAVCLGNDKKSELLSVCKKLVDLSVSRGSIDDVSVMIIQLGCFC